MFGNIYFSKLDSDFDEVTAENRFNFQKVTANIWNFKDNTTDERAIFSSFNSLKDIAVGAGFGLRFDLGFFMLRTDVGFKVYDPEIINNNRWFQNTSFNTAVYNIGINYPF